EQEHVEATEQDGGERCARRFSTRERQGGRVQAVRGQSEVGRQRAGAGVEVVAADREVGLERGAVGVGRGTVLRPVAERGRRPLQLHLRGGDAGAATQEGEQRLVAALRLLGQVA